jgi:hypothetical protein
MKVCRRSPGSPRGISCPSNVRGGGRSVPGPVEAEASSFPSSRTCRPARGTPCRFSRPRRPEFDLHRPRLSRGDVRGVLCPSRNLPIPGARSASPRLAAPPDLFACAPRCRPRAESTEVPSSRPSRSQPKLPRAVDPPATEVATVSLPTRATPRRPPTRPPKLPSRCAAVPLSAFAGESVRGLTVGTPWASRGFPCRRSPPKRPAPTSSPPPKRCCRRARLVPSPKRRHRATDPSQGRLHPNSRIDRTRWSPVSRPPGAVPSWACLVGASLRPAGARASATVSRACSLAPPGLPPGSSWVTPRSCGPAVRPRHAS